MIAMYFFKMKRATALLQKLVADQNQTGSRQEASSFKQAVSAQNSSDSPESPAGLASLPLEKDAAVKVEMTSMPEKRNFKIVVGGVHATVLPEKLLETNEKIDYILSGEAEQLFVDLLNELKNESANRLLKNKEFLNPDCLPFPERELVSKNYKPAPTYYLNLPAYHVITSRGCPFDCPFCSNNVHGRTWRLRSPENVVAEVEYLIRKKDAKEIIFFDDLFTFDKERLKQICKLIIKKGLHTRISWSCVTRIDCVDECLLKIMKEAGCWLVSYGVESGSQRILDLLHKRITLKKVEQIIEMTKRAGLRSRCYFMIGIPTETEEEIIQTINFAINLNPDYAKFNIFMPYPGTAFFEKMKDKIKSFDWGNYKTLSGFTDSELPFLPEGITDKRLKKLQKMAFKRFYFRPSYLLKRISSISSFTEMKNLLDGALSLFFS